MRYLAIVVDLLLAGGFIFLAQPWRPLLSYVLMAIAGLLLAAAVGMAAGRRWGSILGEVAGAGVVLLGAWSVVTWVQGDMYFMERGDEVAFLVLGMALAGLGAGVWALNRRAIQVAQGAGSMPIPPVA